MFFGKVEADDPEGVPAAPDTLVPDATPGDARPEITAEGVSKDGKAPARLLITPVAVPVEMVVPVGPASMPVPLVGEITPAAVPAAAVPVNTVGDTPVLAGIDAAAVGEVAWLALPAPFPAPEELNA